MKLKAQQPTQTPRSVANRSAQPSVRADELASRRIEADELAALQTRRLPESQAFVRGEALVSNLPSVSDDEDMSDLYRELVTPIVAGLENEFGANTASTRMLIELAAHHHVDSCLAIHASRRAAVRDQDAVAAKAAEVASRRAERSTRLALLCIDTLRRPNPSSVRMSIREASVHLGDQVLALGDDE